MYSLLGLQLLLINEKNLYKYKRGKKRETLRKVIHTTTDAKTNDSHNHLSRIGKVTGTTYEESVFFLAATLNEKKRGREQFIPESD